MRSYLFHSLMSQLDYHLNVEWFNWSVSYSEIEQKWTIDGNVLINKMNRNARRAKYLPNIKLHKQKYCYQLDRLLIVTSKLCNALTPTLYSFITRRSTPSTYYFSTKMSWKYVIGSMIVYWCFHILAFCHYYKLWFRTRNLQFNNRLLPISLTFVRKCETKCF